MIPTIINELFIYFEVASKESKRKYDLCFVLYRFLNNDSIKARALSDEWVFFTWLYAELSRWLSCAISLKGVHTLGKIVCLRLLL